MRPLRFPLITLLPVLLLSFACSSGDDSNGGHAGTGKACKDGSECDAGLMCFVAVQGQSGECTALPAECGNTPQCTGTCFDAFKSANCPQGASCLRINASVTITCV